MSGSRSAADHKRLRQLRWGSPRRTLERPFLPLTTATISGNSRAPIGETRFAKGFYVRVRLGTIISSRILAAERDQVARHAYREKAILLAVLLYEG